MSDNLIEEFKEKETKDGSMPCIDCGSAKWQEGPSGGMCTNYQCAECGARFNLGPGMIERIGFNDELRIKWLEKSKRLSEEERDSKQRSGINRHAAIRHTKRKRVMGRIRNFFTKYLSKEVPDA